MVPVDWGLTGAVGTDWARAMLASVRQAARTVVTFAVLVGVFMGRWVKGVFNDGCFRKREC
jgi:hypothetical protein